MDMNELRAQREPVVEECQVFHFSGMNAKRETVEMTSGPCKRIEGSLCAACLKPIEKWRLGNCNLATHIITIEEQKKKINPIKQSKRR